MKNMKKSKFTLVELMVTISIILILICLLMPGLRRARWMAMVTVCANNMRQTHIGQRAYDSDFDMWQMRWGAASASYPMLVVHSSTKQWGWSPPTGAPNLPKQWSADMMETWRMYWPDNVRWCPTIWRWANEFTWAPTRAQTKTMLQSGYAFPMLNDNFGGEMTLTRFSENQLFLCSTNTTSKRPWNWYIKLMEPGGVALGSSRPDDHPEYDPVTRTGPIYPYGYYGELWNEMYSYPMIGDILYNHSNRVRHITAHALNNKTKTVTKPPVQGGNYLWEDGHVRWQNWRIGKRTGDRRQLQTGYSNFGAKEAWVNVYPGQWDYTYGKRQKRTGTWKTWTGLAESTKTYTNW